MLFSTKPSHVDLLNVAASTLFKIIQDIMWKDVVLHIARLTDASKSAGRSNLSFQRLPAAIAHVETKSKVEMALEMALIHTKFCRDWRNRDIAHQDLDLTFSRSASPLESASGQKISEALKSLAEVLNIIATHYLETTTFFESLGPTVGGANNLLRVLDEGVKAMKARQKRLRAGTAVPEDWQGRDL